MATITSSGMNLDVQGLATQLVAADRATRDAQIARRETNLTVQVSGLASLKGALSTFQNALTSLKTVSAFSPRSVTVTDDERFTATADSTAATGSYDIEVLALAKAHQLASGTFADNNVVVGTGTLTITQGGQSFNVVIDSTNNTVAGIRDAVNKATGNTGVQATLIHEQGGTRLVLSSTKTGAAGAIKVTQTGGDGGLDALVYDPAGTKNLVEKQLAQDAHITVAGFDHFSSTNSISGAIDGVTLSLKAVTEEDTPVALSVSADDATVQKNVKAFVDAFNALQKTFAQLRSFNPETKETGPLFGDAMLRQVEDLMRSDLSNPVTGLTGTYTSLASIGITRQLDGSLQLDSTKLTKAMQAGNGAVAQIFGSENGVAARLDKHITAQLETGASFDFRNQSLQKGLEDITDQKAALDAKMEAVRARYIKQFSALDAMLTQMQQTSQYLAQQLASIQTPQG
jgi:flagellar hook-associated protein 2